LREPSSQAFATALLVALPLLSSACAGGGSSHTNSPPLASSVAHYCEEARRLRTQGANLYIALRKAAPTKEVRNDIESVLALNDANFTHFHRVEIYTLNTCGIDLPQYGG
jgi:hypothetical protein